MDAPDPTPEPADRRRSDAVTWARRQLSVDGVRRLSRMIARLLRAIGLLALVVLCIGLVGVAIALLLVADRTPLLIVLIALCAPAIVGSLVARHRLKRLAGALDHPDEIAAQVRDLAVGLRDSTELRQLADRLRHPDRVGGGRLRRLVSTGRLASTVIGQTGPDPKRHPRLVPFTPDRLGALWFSITAAVFGVVLVGFAIVLAILAVLLPS